MKLSDRFSQLTKRAKNTAAGHTKQIDKALTKAARTADQRTGGKYHDKIATTESKAGTYLDGLQPGATEKPHPPADPNQPIKPTA